MDQKSRLIGERERGAQEVTAIQADCLGNTIDRIGPVAEDGLPFDQAGPVAGPADLQENRIVLDQEIHLEVVGQAGGDGGPGGGCGRFQRDSKDLPSPGRGIPGRSTAGSEAQVLPVKDEGRFLVEQAAHLILKWLRRDRPGPGAAGRRALTRSQNASSEPVLPAKTRSGGRKAPPDRLRAGVYPRPALRAGDPKTWPGQSGRVP
jgi:hypothetical protein